MPDEDIATGLKEMHCLLGSGSSAAPVTPQRIVLPDIPMKRGLLTCCYIDLVIGLSCIIEDVSILLYHERPQTA
jgi:hypothetical protein